MLRFLVRSKRGSLIAAVLASTMVLPSLSVLSGRIASAQSSSPPYPVVLEAEDAVHNLVVEAGQGATGRGSVGSWSVVGGFVRFFVSAPSSGTYRVVVRHASAWDAPARRTLIVDGVPVGPVSFPSTGQWGAWTTTQVQVAFSSGSHTFELAYLAGDAGALDVDNITVSLGTPPPGSTSPLTATSQPTPLEWSPAWQTGPVSSARTVQVGAVMVAPVVLEAEDAVHNLVVETDEGGLGSGSIGYWLSVGGYVRFAVNAPVAGTYRLRLRHASAWDVAATRSILVDGVETKRMSFPSTGSWSEWRTSDVSVTLGAGTHAVEFLYSSSDSGALNLDNMTVELLPANPPGTTTIPPPSSTPSPTTAPKTGAPTTTVATTTTTPGAADPTPMIFLEAEDAQHNLVVESDQGGSGRGSLGYWLSVGGFVRFTLKAPGSGMYRLQIRHASAWDAATTRTLLVDDVRVGSVTFPSTGSWNTWRTTDVTISLAAGDHSVQFSYAAGDSGALNMDNMTVQMTAAPSGGPPSSTPTTSAAPPTTTTLVRPPAGGLAEAATPQICAGASNANLVSSILTNRKEGLRGEVSGGVWGMEGVYSVLLNPLEMAINCKDTQMLDSMAYVVLGSAGTLSNSPDGQVWLSGGNEIRLVSAEWVYVLARVIDGISAIPPAQRTANMNAVTQTFVPVVAAHTKRWVFETPFWTLSGCPSSYAPNHLQYLAVLQALPLGGGHSFCNGLIDTDLWIMAAGSELLRAAVNDASLVNLAALGINQSSLSNYARTSGDLLRARLVPTSLTRTNGGAAQGLDFEPGSFSDLESESGWSGYTGTSFPTSPNGAVLVPPATSPNAGWDISHLRPFLHLVNSLRRLRTITGSSFPTDGEMTALSNQFAYGLLVGGNTQWPQFSNYLSGWNGWYRVNYNGRPGFGYGPSDLGNTAFMEGAYGLWAPWNPDLKALNARLATILQATDTTTAQWRTATYAKYWSDFVHAGTPDLDRSTSTFLLQHVAASIGGQW